MSGQRCTACGSRTEFGEQELAPIQLQEESLTTLKERVGAKGLRALLLAPAPTVVLLMARTGRGSGQAYGMVVPISFEYLLEVREVLADDREFTEAQPLLEGL